MAAKNDEKAVLAAIDEWPDELAAIGRRVHQVATETDPDRLMPSAWFLTSLDEATEERIAEIVRSTG